MGSQYWVSNNFWHTQFSSSPPTIRITTPSLTKPTSPQGFLKKKKKKLIKDTNPHDQQPVCYSCELFVYDIRVLGTLTTLWIDREKKPWEKKKIRKKKT